MFFSFFHLPYRMKWRALARMQHNIAANAGSGCHQWLGEPGVACPEVSIVMMIKDEADIIHENLCWHYRLGFRYFIILDNGSKDGTRAKLLEFREQHPDAELYVIDDPSVPYFQNRKITGLCCLAEKLWPSVRWIFPLDADEFICLQEDLAEVIARSEAVHATVLHIAFFDHHDSNDGNDDQSIPFYRRQIYHHLNVKNFKVAFRTLGIREVEMGNHSVEFHFARRNIVNGLNVGIVGRHFAVRSTAQLQRKVINGGRALIASGYPEMYGRHWREWYKRYEEGGDRAIREIYDELRISPAESVRSPFPLDSLIPCG